MGFNSAFKGLMLEMSECVAIFKNIVYHLWLGHLERMEEDRMPKKIFTQEMQGTKRMGRPRRGWREEVERDLQVLGVRRW